MERIKPLYRNIFYISLLIILNAYDCYNKQAGTFYWLQNILPLLFTIPLIIIIDFIPLRYRFKIEAFLHLLFSILCFWFGDKGNLTGVVFLYLFCFCWENKKAVIGFLIITGVIIIIKFDQYNYTNSELLKYLIGCIFIIDRLFFLTWPKKQNIILTGMVNKVTDTHEFIITYLRKGLNQKQISEKSNEPEWKAEEKNLTYNQVHERVGELYELFGAKSTAHLIELLWAGGFIKKTLGKADKQ